MIAYKQKGTVGIEARQCFLNKINYIHIFFVFFFFLVYRLEPRNFETSLTHSLTP